MKGINRGKRLRNNASHFAVESEPKEKRQEKKGRDPGIQGTEGGSFGPHRVPLVLSYVTTVHTLNCVL